ncbi:alpha/beta fold hydrolase [Anaeromyxobacter dehalogenans]|uniref:AB hydrolase-1 domain-containing protein n=1 Tax=Anaeromyxobacter dehalogenans (strain 2CP-C) TaxID=290397 RepID=Q2IE64_ANADE|nr:alpha/beta fold hydrolase [Anaeromyxobacter dehalogenans]ABC82869.1 conserved hypothetical protein [Anaeromyxobacter dehalogenans 2CP-C]
MPVSRPPPKSTNVRSFGARAARAGLRAVSAVAPDLAVRAAGRLLLTPPRHPAPQAERAGLARAEPLAFRVRGEALRAWRLGCGPAVLLLHGWGGRAGQLLPLAEALAAAGCAAVTVDAPAHGASRGCIASMIHFADAAETVARAVGARAAVGHSLGGAAVALAAVRGLELDAAVVIAAPRGPAGFVTHAAAELGLSERALGAEMERRLGVSPDALDLPRLAPPGAPPLLVIHDPGDREVPFADGAALAEGWPTARLIATQGLGHRRILRDAAVIAAAVAHARERLPRCGGCGRLATVAAPEPRCDGCAVADDLWDRDRRLAAS